MSQLEDQHPSNKSKNRGWEMNHRMAGILRLGGGCPAAGADFTSGEGGPTHLIVSQAGARCHPSWSPVAQWLTAASPSQVQAVLLLQPPKSLGLQVHATMPS